jgi:serine phosphatase RsbU (regulator of sigma subunit)
MAFLDKQPLWGRVIFASLVALLVGLAVVNFYNYFSFPTDENFFSTTPSNLYVIKSFPGTITFRKGFFSKEKGDALIDDSLRVGDVVLQVNRDKLKSAEELQRALQAIPRDSVFEMSIFRSAQDRQLSFRVTRAAVPDSFFRVIPPSVHVHDVFKDGASDRAGMKVGDLIYRINDQDFKNAGEADVILRSGQIGKSLAYDILRHNQPITLQLTLAKFGIRFSFLVMALSGLVFMATGAFFLLQRPCLKAARLVGLAFLLSGYILAVMRLQHPLETGAFHFIRDLLALVSMFFGIALWFDSAYYFPKERPEVLARPWLRRVPYALASLCCLFFILNAKQRGDAAFFLALFTMSGATLLYTFVIHFIYKKQRTPEHKRLSRAVRWAGLIGVGSAFVIMYFWGRRWEMGYIGFPLLLIPMAYLYTTGRYRLLDLDLRVRRNIQYTIVSIAWTAALVVVAAKILMTLAQLDFDLPNFHLSGTSIEIVDTPLSPRQHEVFKDGILMVLAIGLAFVSWKVIRFGQRVIDTKFYRGSYDYRRAASELAEVMAAKFSMVDLARGIVQKLAELMHLQRVGVLFFRDQKECCCQEAFGFDGGAWENFCMEIDRKLVATMDKFRGDSRFSVEYLPQSLREPFHKHGFRHLIPIRFKEKMVGTLLVGEKLSEAPFHNEDLTLLTAIAKQASVAIENAFLYEELAEQERLKHELSIARRIQLASLPQTTPRVNGLDIAGVSIPALEVGGDYFDYLNGVPDHITVIVGDVSGKGTSAAIYMSKVQGILRSLHEFDLSPRELFIRANHLLYNDLERKSFVTSIGAEFDAVKHQVVLARAGHLPLFYYRAKSRCVEKITPKGLGFGLDDEGVFAAELEEQTLQYDGGDIFLFVTDGITEAHGDNGAEFGEESVAKILESSSSLTADQIRDQIITAVKRFGAGMNQHDDQTIVVVKAI